MQHLHLMQLSLACRLTRICTCSALHIPLSTTCLYKQHIFPFCQCQSTTCSHSPPHSMYSPLSLSLVASPISEVNLSSPKAPVSYIGNSSCTLLTSVDQALLDSCSQAVMWRIPALPRLSPTFGRKTLESQTHSLRSDGALLRGMILKTGKIYGLRRRLETLYASLQTSESAATVPSALSKKIMRLLDQLKDKYLFIMASQDVVKHVMLGKKQVLKRRTQKILALSSGTVTVVSPMSSSTNFGDRLEYPISSDGLTGTLSLSKTKGELPYYPQIEFGSPVTSRQNVGTPTSIPKPLPLSSGAYTRYATMKYLGRKTN